MAGEIKHWLRFRKSGTTGFGTLNSSGISVHEGDMFGRHAATGKTLALYHKLLRDYTPEFDPPVGSYHSSRAIHSSLTSSVKLGP